jgi:hypothetical protein
MHRESVLAAASVRMTKWRVMESAVAMPAKCGVSPLRCGLVEMTCVIAGQIEGTLHRWLA